MILMNLDHNDSFTFSFSCFKLHTYPSALTQLWKAENTLGDTCFV